MRVKEQFLEIFLLGPGFGEAAIINISNRLLVGIDSCAAMNMPGEDGKRFIDEIVRNMSGNSQIFWIITHYHHDHFHQLHEVLERLHDKISGLIVPEDYTSRDQLENMVLEAQESAGPAIARRATLDYKSLRKILKKATYRIDRVSNDVNVVDVQLRSTNGETRKVTVNVSGQTFSQSNSLRAKALGQLLDQGPKGANRQSGNLGSYIVSIDYGEIRALLLGDAPAERAIKALGDRYSRSGPDYLKVSHHGAEDGTNTKLLDSFGPSSSRKRTAVIAPYRGQRLPRQNIVNALTNDDFVVRICGEGGSRRAMLQKIQSQFEDVVVGRVTSAKLASDCVIASSY